MGRLFDRLLDSTMRGIESQMDPKWRANHETGEAPSYDWCRFRRRRRCMFPRDLNIEATRIAGYAVWVPEDRGLCPRDEWTLQKQCPVSQPGPKSGQHPAFVDATEAWEVGGQRGGIPDDPPFDVSRYISNPEA